MQVQNTAQPLELYKQAQALKKAEPKKPNNFLRTTVATAGITAGSYLGYKKVVSSPALMKKAVNFFNNITGPLFKSSAKNILPKKGKIGALFAAAAALLTGVVATKNAYNKGKYDAQKECYENHKEFGVMYSTTA